ncbi:MAG: hypothetical protein HQL90_15115 [Magnetococcales bacterium]|nr:hypothetical protein [Magnetococcales bacterium]
MDADNYYNINFDVSEEDNELIRQIATRAHAMNPDIGELMYRLDIRIVHANGLPLRLADLLAADDMNFAHDVGGICRNMDKTTGRLGNFVPRFAVPAPLVPFRLEGVNVMPFGPDSLPNPHIAIVFTEQEWDAFQGPIMEAWASQNHITQPSAPSE